MGKYLKKFENHSAYEAAESGLILPNVSYCVTENEVHYNPYVHDYSKEYLTFEIIDDGTITITANDAAIAKTLSYSTNNGQTWTSLTTSEETQSFGTFTAGDKIMFKGQNSVYADGDEWIYNTFGGTAEFNVYGNIMSLIYDDNFVGQTSFDYNPYVFLCLFYGATNIISAENLIMPTMTLTEGCYEEMFMDCTSLTTPPTLPATTLEGYCYCDMFDGCTSLTTAPELPATTLAGNCYAAMFYGCSNLTTAPALPATTLVERCYASMFEDCTSLTTAPALTATTLAWACYDRMFKGCTSLTTAPALPATTLANYCYLYMFQNCTSLTTAPALPATTLAEDCYNGMFAGCTSLTTAPALPATTLVKECYYDMFKGTNVLPDCTNIDFTSQTVVASGGLKGLFSGTKVTNTDLQQLLPKDGNNRYCLPVTTLANKCYYQMFSNCTALTTAPELPATTLAEQCYCEMFYGCTGLVNAPTTLPATTLVEKCYYYMFKNCTGLVNAPVLPATTLRNYCYQNMFENCTSLETAPVLPSTTLQIDCYREMFKGCTNLNYIKAMFTTQPNNGYTQNWVSGVAATGTFVKNSAATWNVTGNNGVPNGWTVETASE